MIIESTGLTVRYRGSDKPALSAVDFRLDEAELVAVVGPNGSGKSTMLAAVLGLVPLAAGRSSLLGRDVGAWSRADIARTVGVVAQREETLYPLSVEDTVMLGRYPHLGALAPAGEADLDAVRSALDRCDLTGFRTRRTDTLSGGEWQRVRVARALAQRPRVLLLDEPTAALDVRHEMEVFELVRQLSSEGLGALVITHHLNLAARYADRMLLLAEGGLVAEGTPIEVLERARLSRVFAWPVAVTSWHGAPQVVPVRPGEESFS